MQESKIIHLPQILDQRGNLLFIEGNNHIPFEIKRTLWIYDIPEGGIHNGSAYHQSEEFIIALSGSFDVVLNDGIEELRYNLGCSYYGLYIPKMIWRHMENFAQNSFVLVLSSNHYDEDDYIRDFELYKKEMKI